MDIRIFLMMLMNAITNALNKEERLKFCFNLIDQEENRMITFEDLLLILLANYFAGSPEEVYGKGLMLIKETSQSKSPDDPITWDDYQMLSRKFQNLFYPSTLQDNANKVGAKVQGNVFNVLD
jgi:hypothetical protein